MIQPATQPMAEATGLKAREATSAAAPIPAMVPWAHEPWPMASDRSEMSSPRPVPAQNDVESCRDATNEFSLTTKHHHESQNRHGTQPTS